ncbi:glucuronoxylan 4-O-methyltransferase-like protein (DUF579) [Tasmannia lanceolata]|uniref:glucuronoxylan 4-O-methyltransferase-like protein (DUF579) n=1 Tax=Tasmannia lanceolata TaxID=3420 RepID=UPI004064C77B
MARLPLIALFVLSTISILRFLKITTNTSSSSAPPLPQTQSLTDSFSSPSPSCAELPPPVSNTLTHHPNASKDATLTTKELHLLSNVISLKVPCNLLVFGLNPQLDFLSTLNVGGTTLFLEDDVKKIMVAPTKFKTTYVYEINQTQAAGEAYELLRRARIDPACMPRAKPLQASRCPLALTLLPKLVYEHKWDVVVIDGPSGDRPEAPGRMAVIYTTGMMAKAGAVTDVLVHDVDRTVEKWYSWEFLCQENLVSSKGKFWHFKIIGLEDAHEGAFAHEDV